MSIVVSRYILGKPLDDTPYFRERCASFKNEMIFRFWQFKKVPQCPTYPEILFDHFGHHARVPLRFEEQRFAISVAQANDCLFIHFFATSRNTGRIHAGT